MADFQEKLLRYRKQKERQEKFLQFKKKIMSFILPNVEKPEESGNAAEKTETIINDVPAKKSLKENTNLTAIEYDSEEQESESEESDLSSNPPDKLQYFLWLVYFLFWLTMYVIAIELQFGIVFLMFSALFGIYLNTRTGKRRRHEMSAYSVFNKNCESIDGSLKAEQFEREMGYKPV